jgi:RNA polymerase sigma-70 factor (ECF subfamily)
MVAPMQAMAVLMTAADPPLARKGTTPGPSDATLMAAFLRKEPDAARHLYDRFASRIYGLGMFLLRNKADAEDLVQDTFLKIWRGGAAFDPVRGSLDTWILLNARSLAIDLLRRRSVEARKLSSQAPASEASDEAGPEQHTEVADLVQRAGEAMARLPHRQRSVLELQYIGGRSTKEVAELLGIPRGTVKSRAHTAIGSLQKVFRDGADDAA